MTERKISTARLDHNEFHLLCNNHNVICDFLDFVQNIEDIHVYIVPYNVYLTKYIHWGLRLLTPN